MQHTATQHARDCIARGDWSGAAASATRAIAAEESAEAHELLGLASWWLSDIEALFRSRERAWQLYVAADERRRAARVGVWLDWDYRAFRGEPAVAQGWLRRVRRLLATDTDCAEYGWLLMREADAQMARDAAGAAEAAAEAAALGRRHADRDLEHVALSLEGLARVAAGSVSEGMQQLDEATASVVAGEFVDRSAAGVTCCHLIMACDLVRDFDRAGQWCTRVREYCSAWNHPPLFAVCRTQYAGVLMSNGSWADAEAELQSAIIELKAMRPGWTSLGTLQLAELRRRQGRLDEAATMYESLAATPAAWLGLAAIALERGAPSEALRHARHFLRQVPRGNHTARASALELIVLATATMTAALATDRRSRAATEELLELQQLAERVESLALRASAALATAASLSARGDHERATEAFEEAVSLFERAASRYDALRSRLLLAVHLHATGAVDAANAEATAVVRQARELGAASLESNAASLLGLLSSPAPKRRATESTGDTPLTARERDVLALLVEGLTNRQMAAQLSLSPHTVHRHVSNLFTKLGLASRAAAVAYGIRHGFGGTPR
jgi:ATP/maltotriose-dependent transcriptional regulator MalT